MLVKYSEIFPCAEVHFLKKQKKERKQVGIYNCYQATLPSKSPRLQARTDGGGAQRTIVYPHLLSLFLRPFPYRQTHPNPL